MLQANITGALITSLLKKQTDTTDVWQHEWHFCQTLSWRWGSCEHTHTHSCTHTSKYVTSIEVQHNAQESIFSLGKRNWHALDIPGKPTAELIQSYSQWSSSYVNTLFKVEVVIKQEETEVPLAVPTVHEGNKNVTEYWHLFHFELNTALLCISRDNIKFRVWVIPGILQAGAELYLVG